MAETLDFLLKLNLALTGNFPQEADIFNSKFSMLQESAKRLEAAMGSVKAFEKLSGSVSGQAQKLAELQRAYNMTSANAQAAGMRTAQLAREHEIAKQRVQELTSKYPRHSQQVREAMQRERELARQYRDSAKETKALEEAKAQLADKVSSAQEKFAGEEQKLAEMSKALRDAGINTDDLATRQQKLQASLERVNAAQARLKDIRQTLSLGNIKSAALSVLPVVAAIKPSVTLAADFESAMAKVRAVAFTNEDADMSLFAKLQEQARQLEADTKFTAIQAANAQENLLRANMSPQDVLAAMPAVLNMASAEGMDIATASSIIAKGLGGMNLEGKYAPRLGDILAFTSANSNTNIAEIGEAFKGFAPVAQSQGMTMEQAATYIGALANAGYTGSEAGNALSKSVQRLAALPTEGAKIMQKLGVAFQTRDGRLRELPDILIGISEAMQARKYGEVQQLEVMERVFGKNYGAPMLALMSKAVSGQVATLQNGVYNNSYGRAQLMADINLDTLNGQIDILKSAWDGLRTSIGDIFSPYIRKGIEQLSAALSSLTQAMKDNPEYAQAIVLSLTALAGAKTIASIWKIGGAILQLPGAWLEAVNATREAGRVISGAPSLWSRAVGAISGTLSWLGGIIMAHPLVTLGVLIGGAVALAIKYSDQLKAWWDEFEIPEVWEPLKTQAGEAIDWLKGLWDEFSTWLGNLFSNLNPFNWEMPSWLKAAGGSSEQQVKNANAALSGNLPGFATGGILTKHSVIQVAEEGPEAIIPLTDKSRGLPLLYHAADMLGVNLPSESVQTQGIKESVNRVRDSVIVSEGVHSGTGYSTNVTPQINLTINVEGRNGEDDSSLAERIAQSVRETLAEIMSLEERVSYA